MLSAATSEIVATWLASSQSPLLATAEATATLSDQFFGSSVAVVASAASNPFRYFNSSPEIIGLAVLMYVKYPLSLRNVEDLLAERGIDISNETVRLAGCAGCAAILGERRGVHLDEAFVKVNGLCRDPHA